METNQFALHNGKIVYVPEVPEANDFVDQDDVSTRFDQAGYDKALQSAIANGIEVSNPKDIGFYGGIILEKNKLYTLNCRVEIISCIGGCKNFEKSGDSILICRYNGCQYKVAHVTFPEQKPEPEAAGQEQTASLQKQVEEKSQRIAQLEEALKSIRGIEAWIGDREMKELFQRKVYGALNPQDNQKEK